MLIKLNVYSKMNFLKMIIQIKVNQNKKKKIISLTRYNLNKMKYMIQNKIYNNKILIIQ